MTLSYVRIFNEALVTFVKKHYTRKEARLFVLFIKIGIALRAVLGTIKRGLKVLHMPLLDAIILFGCLYGIKEFWVEHVKGMLPIKSSSVYATFPAYIVLWLLSLYLNSAYDSPYRGLKVMRGMLVGTIAILAYYGLLPPEFRYSRAIIIFTGFAGTVALLGMHEILYRLGVLKFVPYDKLPKKAVIVAEETAYNHTSAILEKVHYAPELAGRISTNEASGNALAPLHEMKELLFTTGVNEVIFCINGLTYKDVFTQMQHCGAAYEYKIHLEGSQSFVGSNSSSTSGDLYTIDRSFNLSSFSQLRNKRMVDIAGSLLLLLTLPVTFFRLKHPGGFIANCFKVLQGRYSWIGYAAGTGNGRLPAIKPGILPPFNILPGYEPSEPVRIKINIAYAQHYAPINDITLMLKNFRFLGNQK